MPFSIDGLTVDDFVGSGWRDAVEQAKVQKHSILGIMPMQYKNAMGRTVARRDPPEFGETEDEADLRIGMYKTATLSQLVHVQASVIPARAQILREHTVQLDDIFALIRDNPIVPEGREDFFVRGLHAGFKGDFATATHFLIPQIENSVRYLLEASGVISSGLDDDGIQDERDLNRTLRLPEFADPLRGMMGEDFVFDLRGLLIERYGSNLRNDMAHGLLDYASFSSASCIYLWWLVLRLCCTPIIMGMQAAWQDEATETADDTNQSAVSGGDAAAEKEEV